MLDGIIEDAIVVGRWRSGGGGVLMTLVVVVSRLLESCGCCLRFRSNKESKIGIILLTIPSFLAKEINYTTQIFNLQYSANVMIDESSF